METEGVSFPEAVERLAAEAGVALPAISREASEAESRRKSLHEVMELASAYFEAQLHGRAGAAARDYLARRGLSGDIQRRFRIGYATPERYALRDHLAAKGVAAEVMVELGLLVSGEDVSVPFDRFRDRVMFPIGDGRGRIVAFGGRAMSADVAAKYLNSPDTPLFNKGRLLYNLHQARGPAHERGTIVAVEGYVDVIAMTMAGFCERRRAARHGTDRGPARAPVALRRRAGPVLRRRQGRAPRRLPGDRPRLAEPLGRQVAAFRAPARRAGPGRPPARGRPVRRRAGAERRPAARRPALGPRDRGRPARHAGAPRGARAAPAPGARRDPRRDPAALLPRQHRRAAGGDPRGRAAPVPPRFRRWRPGRQPRPMVERRRAPPGRQAGGAPRQPTSREERAVPRRIGVVVERSLHPQRLVGASGTPARARRDPERARPCRPRREGRPRRPARLRGERRGR